MTPEEAVIAILLDIEDLLCAGHDVWNDESAVEIRMISLFAKLQAQCYKPATTRYEIHVTMNSDDGRSIPSWSQSKIDGDPNLGTGERFYRTTQCTSLRFALALVEKAKREWPNAIRYKIEHVIHDDRRDTR